MPSAQPHDAEQVVDVVLQAAKDLEGLDVVWTKHHASIPNRLFHYTTAVGCAGILRDQALHASNALYLNDTTENTYGSSLAASIISEVLTEPRYAGVVDAFTSQDKRRLIPTLSEPYVVCFSEKRDQLSQWRGYGGGDAPVSIGFNFTTAMFEDRDAILQLRRVVYNQDVQRESLRDLVLTWKSSVEAQATAGKPYDDLLHTLSLTYLDFMLWQRELTFKDPAFHEEAEWRLIRHVSSSPSSRNDDSSTSDEASPRPEVNLRPSALGLTPFVILNSADPLTPWSALPIDEIVQGPTANAELALHSLELLLRSTGCEHVRLSRSAVPLRR